MNNSRSTQTAEKVESGRSAPRTLGRHALVIGGSIGGMMTARVLADHFAHVTVIERDAVADVPEPRKGQPQARHLHGLLAGGREAMESLYPGLAGEVIAHGGLTGDMGELMRWHIYGGWRKPFHAGLPGLLCSRPLLEWQIRRRTLALPNVALLDQTAVQELLWDDAKACVVGLRVHRRAEGRVDTPAADLVVDVSGRGSVAPKWLEEAGYGRPPEAVVKNTMAYATRIYARPANNPLGISTLMIGADPVRNPRTGLIFPIEGERWIVALGGRGDDAPPTDEEGYLAFARSLEAPDLYQILRGAQPLSSITPYRFPSNLRRHYERMPRFPEGLLVLGDALCSFNPIYGQGMSSAARQVLALQRILAESAALEGIARLFFAAADKVLAVPWKLTVGEDFRYATTEGTKPPMQDAINAYVAKVHRATQRDTTVYAAFLKVMNLLAPPQSLFAPGIVARVLWGRGEAYQPEPVVWQPLPAGAD